MLPRIGSPASDPISSLKECAMSAANWLFAQNDQFNFNFQETPANGGRLTPFAITELALLIFGVVAHSKVFVKARHARLGGALPIYNVIVLLRIASKPWWWIFLMIVPLVNIVILFLVSIDIAKNFGQGVGFGIGLALLAIVFYPILAFGDARYNKVV